MSKELLAQLISTQPSINYMEYTKMCSDIEPTITNAMFQYYRKKYQKLQGIPQPVRATATVSRVYSTVLTMEAGKMNEIQQISDIFNEVFSTLKLRLNAVTLFDGSVEFREYTK